MPIRFHLDEHVPTAVARALTKHGVDVTTTSDLDLIGASDRVQLTMARQDGRVFFTQDADFLRLHAEGVEHAGIVFGSRRLSIGRIIDGLLLVYYVP